MTKQELMELDYKIINYGYIEEIESMEEVIEVVNCGISGTGNNKNWYVVTLEDNTEINLYL